MVVVVVVDRWWCGRRVVASQDWHLQVVPFLGRLLQAIYGAALLLAAAGGFPPAVCCCCCCCRCCKLVLWIAMQGDRGQWMRVAYSYEAEDAIVRRRTWYIHGGKAIKISLLRSTYDDSLPRVSKSLGIWNGVAVVSQFTACQSPLTIIVTTSPFVASTPAEALAKQSGGNCRVAWPWPENK